MSCTEYVRSSTTSTSLRSSINDAPVKVRKAFICSWTPRAGPSEYPASSLCSLCEKRELLSHVIARDGLWRTGISIEWSFREVNGSDPTVAAGIGKMVEKRRSLRTT